MKNGIKRSLTVAAMVATVAFAAEWSAPVDVQYDDKRCISYRARWSGDFLEVQATLEPGWHTFAMDNKQRQQEKLAGKPSLGIERSTEITLADGLNPAGPWLESPPKDFSKPELRYYSWGYEQQAVFAVKTRGGSVAGPIRVRGQACSESICKNIDVSLPPPPRNAKSDPELKALTPVK